MSTSHQLRPILLSFTAFAVSTYYVARRASARQHKHNVDLLITGGTVLAMDSEKHVYEQGVVAIKDNSIVSVGAKELRHKFNATEVIELDGDIVMPGLINTHTHASMTLFRSLADDEANRLHGYIFPLEKKFVSPDMVRIGADLGNVEMVLGGVTTYCDMYYFEDQVAESVNAIGMRAVLGETIIQHPVADAANAEEGIQYALNFIHQYATHPRITPAFAPHAPYTNTTSTLQRIAALSLQENVPIITHLAESQREKQVIYERSGGLSPVQYLEKIGFLNSNLIGAHVIDVTDQDMTILHDKQVGIAHCMSANLKSAKGVSPALTMFQRNMRVGLGTDGPMSSNTLSTLSELSLVAKVHKLIAQDRTAMPAKVVVEMATIGAARALHMEDSIGSLEVGKRADLCIIDTHVPNMTPMYNPYSALVFGANPSNVLYTICDGKVIMRKRSVTTVDELKIRKRAEKFARRIRSNVELGSNPL